LALLGKKSPGLALLFERWDMLPDTLRAGISAIARFISQTALPENTWVENSTVEPDARSNMIQQKPP
jgi:hypothetical protein